MSQFKLLRARRFVPLFGTQFLGAFNDNVYKNALVILITFQAATQGGRDSAMMVTIAAGIFILPFFLFSAFAGQLADKYEKSVLIRRIKLAEIGIMVVGATGFLTGNVSLLMAVLFLMGTQSSAFGPLKYGILPQHLTEDELTGGNGLIQMGTFLAILVGTMLGGISVTVPDWGPRLTGAMVITLAVLGWWASRSIPQAAAPEPALVVDWNVPRQTWRILGFARENRTVFLCIIGISWFWFIGATFLQLLPSFTRNTLGGNAHAVTLMLTAFSLGIGVGAMFCERLSKGRIEPGLVPLGAVGLSLFATVPFLVGAVPPVEMAGDTMRGISELIADSQARWILGGFIGLALFGGFYIVPLYAMLQTRSAVERRARIIAANNVMNALFMVCSALLTMVLLGVGLEISEIFLAVAVLNVVVTTWVFLSAPEFLARFSAWLRHLRQAEK